MSVFVDRPRTKCGAPGFFLPLPQYESHSDAAKYVVTVKLFASLCLLALLFFSLGNARAADRIFDLHIVNQTPDPVTFTIIGENCYQGRGWDNPNELIMGPVAPGDSVTMYVARDQSDCDGENGYFSLEPSTNSRSRTHLFLTNDGGLALNGGLPNNYHVVLGDKDPGDGSYTLTMLPLSERFDRVPDDRLERPFNNIAADSGYWGYVSDWASDGTNYYQTTATNDVLHFDRGSFSGSRYASCVGQPLFHPQHVKRLRNKNGRAYFMITQSWAISGSMYLVETYEGVLDPVTDRVIPSADGSPIGEIIWQDIYHPANPVGNWNHPGKMAVMDGVLVMAAQNWSEGVGLNYFNCSKDENPYQRGHSEDAVLFYDVRDPSAPKYWGKMTGEELGVPESDYDNGRHEGGEDRMISVVSLVRTPSFRGIYDQFRFEIGGEAYGYHWELTAGGSRDGGGFVSWTTDKISPNISDWTMLSEARYISGEHGDNFTSYQVEADHSGRDSPLTPPSGFQRPMSFRSENMRAGFGEKDGFAFGGSGVTDAYFLNIDRDVDWIAESLYISPKGVPIAYTVENRAGPDGSRSDESTAYDPYLFQVWDSRNDALQLPERPFVVTSSDDGSTRLKTLREGIGYGGTITFAPELDGKTIELGERGPLVAIRDVVIDASNLKKGITISGSGASPILHVAVNDIEVELIGVNLIDGHTDSRRSVSFKGGAINNEGSLTIRDSTIARSYTANTGGGIFNASGAALSLVNTTVADNEGSDCGIYNEGTLTLNHVTVANASCSGDGLAGPGSLAMSNSVVDRMAVGGTYTTDAPNVITTGSVGTSPVGTPHLVVLDLSLAPLGNYGGPTLTRPPLASSAAIDYAAVGAVTDQRGYPRPNGSAPDAGAVESQLDLTVSNTASSGAGSLSWAIENSLLDGVNIVLDPSMDGQVINLPSELTIDKKVTINAKSLPNGIVITGDVNGNGLDPGDSRIFLVGSGGELTLQGVTLSGGHSGAEGGAAIKILGGGIVNIEDSTLENNIALGDGGAIEVLASGQLNLENSTISGNSAHSGGAISNQGGTVDLVNSTLTDNEASRYGGAIANSGGSLSLLHTTVADNSVSELEGGGGGISNYDSGTLTTENSIIAGNRFSGTGTPVALVGADIDNTGSWDSTEATQPGAAVNAVGDNLVGDNETVTSEFPAGPLHGTSLDPIDLAELKLSPLGHYGGPTRTMPPLRGSPALDATSSALLEDQRGFSRRNVGTNHDLGAVESGLDFYVGLAGGTGPYTLRDALAKAVLPEAVVKFNPDLNGEVIYLGGTSMTINSDVTIDATELSEGIILSGDTAGDGPTPDDSRIFELTAGGELTLKGITLTGGYANTGGAIYIDAGSLIMEDSTLTANRAVGSGDDGRGGAIFNLNGTVQLERVAVLDNVADNMAGGIMNKQTTGESAEVGLVNTLLSGNAANSNGGGLLNEGGSVNIEHTAIVDNVVTGGGLGGGIDVAGGSVNLENSIVADNTGPSPGGGVDLSVRSGGTANRSGNNLIGNNDTVSAAFPVGEPNANGDFVGVSAQLSPLGDYGGLTHSRLPLSGSRAIDGAVASARPSDQRGYPRPAGAASDIGPVESLITSTSPGQAQYGVSVRPSFSWEGTPGATYLVWVDSGDGFVNVPGLFPEASFTLPWVLPYNTLVRWRVDTELPSGAPVIIGYERSFTTRGPPVVTTALDENDGALGLGAGDSLREAIADSGPGETIVFDAALSGQTIRLGGTELMLDKSLTIDASSLPDGLVISGDVADDGPTSDDSRIFSIPGSFDSVPSVELIGMTLEGGNTSDDGGAIKSRYANLTLTDVALAGNRATRGGGLFFLEGNVTINDSLVENNEATGVGSFDGGGGIYGQDNINDDPTNLKLLLSTVRNNTATNHGGGIHNYSVQVEIDQSTVSGNTALNGLGGGIYDYAGVDNHITASTVSGNRATVGAGISTRSAEISTGLHLLNATIAGNTTIAGSGSSVPAAGGGLYLQGSTATVRHTTITDNSGNENYGGGVVVQAMAVLNIENSLVAGNSGIVAPDIYLVQGTINATGANLIGNNRGVESVFPSDGVLIGDYLAVIDPMLLPLAYYGGPTATALPRSMSPAVDSAISTVDDPGVDQRALPRLGASQNDLGSVEWLTDFDDPDTDGDGIIDSLDSDDDGDTIPDAVEREVGRNELVADWMLDAGNYHNCVIDDNGVDCWAYNNEGQTTVPALSNPRQVSAGRFHSCAIDDTGVVCWGDNALGQAPALATGLVNPRLVGAGSYHSCALDANGVKCWGDNNPTWNQLAVPALIIPRDLAVGSIHSCALDLTGVVCWGDNSRGQSTVPDLRNPVAVAAGHSHTCALDSDGLHCWGAGETNTGASPEFGQSIVPLDLSNPWAVAAGELHTCAIDDTGVRCWGLNDYGQSDAPALRNPVAISLGYKHSCALDDSGVVCWGLSNTGQTNVPALAFDKDLDGLLDRDEDANNNGTVDAGETDPLDADTDGDGLIDGADPFPLVFDVDTDGDGSVDSVDTDDDNDTIPDSAEDVNGNGIVDEGETDPLNADTDGDGLRDNVDPFPLLFDPDTDRDGIVDRLDTDDDNDTIPDELELSTGRNPLVADWMVDVGKGNIYCVLDDEGVKCWGFNGYGQRNVPPLNNPSTVSVGTYHACALDDDGVHCWGAGSTATGVSPEYGQSIVPPLNNPVAISAGAYHSCALSDDGVICWGAGTTNTNVWPDYGQSNVPPLINPVDVVAGSSYTCARDDTGLKCWGKNPPAPGELTNLAAYRLGDGFTLTLDDTGVKHWGYNGYGLGTVPELINPLAISAGKTHACALDDSGVTCWGDNYYGQTDVPGTLINPVSVSAGDGISCALDATGFNVKCWGYSYYGPPDAQPLSFDKDLDGLSDSVEDADGNGIVDAGETDPLDPDTDGDGLLDGVDPFPLEAGPDNDGDGIIDSLDPDDDNDGYDDEVDAFPFNAAAALDSDNDGMPDAWNPGCDEACQDASGLTLDPDFSSDPCANDVCRPFMRGWRSAILQASP